MPNLQILRHASTPKAHQTESLSLSGYIRGLLSSFEQSKSSANWYVGQGRLTAQSSRAVWTPTKLSQPSTKKQKVNPLRLAFLFADPRPARVRCGAADENRNHAASHAASTPTAPASPAPSVHPPAAGRRSDHAGARRGPARIPSNPAPAGSRPSGAGAAA